MNNCGGCAGLGSHRRHCHKHPNYDYRLVLADYAESLGDRIGPNDTVSANAAYGIAGRLRALVRDG